MRILYRARQFWHSVYIKSSQHGLVQEHERLTPAQRALFDRLQLDEQAHAMTVYHKLLEQGENQPDLLVAALLHDVGKLRYRLNPIERTVTVLAKAILPKQAKRWGSLPPGGWESLPGLRKAFIIAEQHAHWGAEMARQAGVSPLTENLIRRHQGLPDIDSGDIEHSLLQKLRAADNDS